MPRQTVRTRQAEQAAAAYVRYRRFRAQRLRKRRLGRAGSHSSRSSESSSDTFDSSSSSESWSSSSESDRGGSDDENSSSDWPEMIGSGRHARSAQIYNHDQLHFEGELAAIDPDGLMPELIPAAQALGNDSDSESETSTASVSGGMYTSSSAETSSISLDDPTSVPPPLGRYIRNTIEDLYAHRYTQPRTPLPRGPSTLVHVLSVLKHERPDEFRKHLRVTPLTFDKIISAIIDDSIFCNNSPNAQLSVEHQLAIALYRFGHFGNGCSVGQVATWAGVGAGTVLLCTRRVMTAVLRKQFRDRAVRMPTDEEKAKAKQWVSKRACKAWQHGWCLVDGTLVPLFDRPFWFGESYFDRKCNYSLNIQIVSLPDLRIIDYSYGFTGSTHDSTAFEQTRMAQEHEELLEPHEWIWADSAYPLETWLISPFKRPERDLPENHQFNNHVSMVRIRSEHAIGFLKGRFQSLKGLRVRIDDEASHKFAGYWAAACINVHAFALQCEAEEREDDDDIGPENDEFIAQGLEEEESDGEGDRRVRAGHLAIHAHLNRATGRARIAAAKARREELKELLSRAKERRRERRQAALLDAMQM